MSDIRIFALAVVLSVANEYRPAGQDVRPGTPEGVVKLITVEEFALRVNDLVVAVPAVRLNANALEMPIESQAALTESPLPEVSMYVVCACAIEGTLASNRRHVSIRCRR
jgi:hypothetical protein